MNFHKPESKTMCSLRINFYNHKMNLLAVELKPQTMINILLYCTGYSVLVIQIFMQVSKLCNLKCFRIPQSKWKDQIQHHHTSVLSSKDHGACRYINLVLVVLKKQILTISTLKMTLLKCWPFSFNIIFVFCFFYVQGILYRRTSK